MVTPDRKIRLEEQIEQWRGFLRRRQAIHPVDVEEMEDHLREQVSALLRANLTEDEAFLIAVKRLGDSTRSRGPPMRARRAPGRGAKPWSPSASSRGASAKNYRTNRP